MSSENQVCMVLKPGVSRADFEKAAVDFGCVCSATRLGDGERKAYVQVWTLPNPTGQTAEIYYFEDPIPNFSYLVVNGHDATRFAVRLAGLISVYTPDELLNDALDASAHQDQVRAINRLAIGFVHFDPTVYTIITTFALQAQNPVLREAAVNAIAVRAWPHFRPLLEQIVAQDAAENVRRRAALLLAHWPASTEATT